MKDVKYVPWIFMAITVIAVLITQWDVFWATSFLEKIAALGFLAASAYFVNVTRTGRIGNKVYSGEARAGFLFLAFILLCISAIIAIGKVG